MNYLKAIFLMNGEVITITEEECKNIQKVLTERPQGFLTVQGEMINKSSIVKVGSHHATAFIKKIDNYQKETDLKLKDGETLKLAEPDYYIDEKTGEKMYA